MALMFDVKLALYEELKRSTPAGVQCTFAQTGAADRRSQMWFGETTTDESEPVGMRAGAAKPLSVTGAMDVQGVVISPGGPLDAERAAYRLRDCVTVACLALDRRSVPGLIDVRPESVSVETAETTDGAYSALSVRVRVRGRVT
ncbi:hypothetical protein [Streptomyces alkaliterrae]|uniref:DUF3168 domain-containing protein n=1 Tax=Streptomyces alkaliterrae TaxID=2213162 RepID=A0A5P0YIX1_9ACTN|nr:hypothetical protein [Streptomyces alkaliterrae]MBB1251840.1 hypothetical protein [Streptomyces alkaliterrae]MBB1259299.1 hypothetical protein [Streptomyces alkaliterrae]MQS00323.1 hypothetical protein [Streptomyces alkaliterrae]